MLHCNYCNFLKTLSDSEEFKLCNKYMCEYSKHVFLDSEFTELNEHPCFFLTGVDLTQTHIDRSDELVLS